MHSFILKSSDELEKLQSIDLTDEDFVELEENLIDPYHVYTEKFGQCKNLLEIGFWDAGFVNLSPEHQTQLFKAIGETQSLEKFYIKTIDEIEWADLSEIGFSALLNTFKCLPRLKKIELCDLQRCSIEQLTRLHHTLNECHRLESLSIVEFPMHDVEVEKIEKVMSLFGIKGLKHLNLSHMHLGAMSTIQFENFFYHFSLGKGLKKIKLDFTSLEQWNEECWSKFQSVIKTLPIKYLSLKGNDLSKLSEKSFESFCELLEAMPFLVRLNLDRCHLNDLPENQKIRLKTVLQNLPNLKNIKGGVVDNLEIFPKNNSIKSYDVFKWSYKQANWDFRRLQMEKKQLRLEFIHFHDAVVFYLDYDRKIPSKNLTLDEIFRTNQILNSLKKDNYTSNRIDRLSLRQLRLLHKCISVISEEYPSNYVSTINNYVDNCIKFRLSYVAQHTAVKNKQTYQDLIENASWPLYGSLENDDKINILFDGAKKIAKRIHEKQYLKDSWKDRSIRAFEKDKYCALKAYELGYITIDDLSTFLVLCDFQIDSIVYPEAQIKIKAIDIETATKKNIPTVDRGINNLLEFYLFNSAWRANETEYKLIVELIKTLPSHSQLLFEISFKYDEAPGFYQKIPRQFFGMGQYGDSGIVEIPFYPQSIYEVIRKVHFCGMPLVNIKHAIGVIDETQIAEDMYRNTHVMNYNFPSQEKMLKADGERTGHAYFTLHDRDYHTLLVNCIPPKLRGLSVWLQQKMTEAGLIYNKQASNSLFNLVDMNYYKLMHLYQGLKQQYPYMSHRALQALMMEQRYALFAEILSIVITNHHICLLCSDESYSKWFSSQSEEYKNILREQKLVSLEHDGMQWQGSIVADLEVIKHHSRMLPDLYKSWKSTSQFINDLLSLLKENREKIRTLFDMDVDEMFTHYTFEEHSYGSEILPENRVLSFYRETLVNKVLHAEDKETIYYEPVLLLFKVK